jgi:ABC-type Na+ efflux pump permease subunit
MAINGLGKNSIGLCLSLLLVILLSESRLFKIFTDTYLGRAFLIIIILFASYLHKILGVVCVLIIIIMFNNNSFSSYYEGFDGNTGDASDDKKDKKDSMSATTTTGDNKNKPITTPTPVPNDKIDVVTSSKDTKNVTGNDGGNDDSNTASNNNVVAKAIEGFDLQSTENNIKRGKQSNSIPVNQYNKQSIEVAPYESASFSNFFGLL